LFTLTPLSKKPTSGAASERKNRPQLAQIVLPSFSMR
jgi:hypothetical protein